WGSEAELRRLLLSPEPPLCSLRDRSLRHVSAGPSRRAAAAQPAAVRVPAGAPAAGGMGVPVGQRTGRAAPISAASRPGRYVSHMFWPLIGGFIAFVLVAILLGWI